MSVLNSPSQALSPNISVSSYSHSHSHPRSPIPRLYALSLRRSAAHHSSYRRSLSSSQVSTSHTFSPATSVYSTTLQHTASSAPAIDKERHRVRSVDVGTQYTPLGLPPTTKRPMTSFPMPSYEAPMVNYSKDEIAMERTETREPPGPSLGQDLLLHMPTATSSGSKSLGTIFESPSVLRSPTKKTRGKVPREILPLDYMLCNIRDLGIVIADMLLELIRVNDQLSVGNLRLTRYHSRALPGISVHDYLNRLIVHATLSPPILLAIVYYIDKLCALYPIFNINSLTVHRYLITVATVAAKGLSDTSWTNNTYAKVGGIPSYELALLELDFLDKVDWRIVPPADILMDYYRNLVERNDNYDLEQLPERASR